MNMKNVLCWVLAICFMTFTGAICYITWLSHNNTSQNLITISLPDTAAHPLALWRMASNFNTHDLFNDLPVPTLVYPEVSLIHQDIGDLSRGQATTLGASVELSQAWLTLQSLQQEHLYQDQEPEFMLAQVSLSSKPAPRGALDQELFGRAPNYGSAGNAGHAPTYGGSGSVGSGEANSLYAANPAQPPHAQMQGSDQAPAERSAVDQILSTAPFSMSDMMYESMKGNTDVFKHQLESNFDTWLRGSLNYTLENISYHYPEDGVNIVKIVELKPVPAFASKMDSLVFKDISQDVLQNGVQDISKYVYQDVSQDDYQALSQTASQYAAQNGFREVSKSKDVLKVVPQGISQGMLQGAEQGLAQSAMHGVAQGAEQGVARGYEQGVAQGLAQAVAYNQLQSPAFLLHKIHQQLCHVNLDAKHPQQGSPQIELNIPQEQFYAQNALVSLLMSDQVQLAKIGQYISSQPNYQVEYYGFTKSIPQVKHSLIQSEKGSVKSVESVSPPKLAARNKEAPIIDSMTAFGAKSAENGDFTIMFVPQQV